MGGIDLRARIPGPPGRISPCPMPSRGRCPSFIEIGGKVSPAFFISGYLGLGFGGAAGQFDSLCRQGNLNCVTVGARIGAEIRYHVLPGEMTNPWIGYGIGYGSRPRARRCDARQEVAKIRMMASLMLAP